MKPPLRRARDAVEAAEQAVMNLLLLAMALLVTLQVLSRYIVSLPAFWLEEMARMTLVWMTFLGTAVAIAKGINLVVTFLADRLPRGYTRGAKIVTALIQIVLFTILIGSSWQLVQQLIGVSTSASGIPRGLLFVAPLVGFSLSLVHALIELVAEIKGTEEDVTSIEELTI